VPGVGRRGALTALGYNSSTHEGDDMGCSLQDFCRDATEILKTGLTRPHVDRVKDAATGKIQRI
jgi:hypothetical protein